MEPNKNNKLTSEDLGEVTKTKKKGPVTVLVMMVILVAFTILLPNIVDFVKNINLRNISIPSIKDNKDENKEEEEEPTDEEEIVYYDFLENTSISYDKVTYTGFKTVNLDDTYISFDITNTKSDTYDLSTKNLYLELYNDDTLLERVKIASYENLIKDNPYNLKFLINANLNITKIRILAYDTSDYPALNLTANAEGISTLTCTNLESKLVYEFNNDSLVKITETYNYTNTDLEKYASILTTYKAKQETMDALEGITATLVESGVNFSYNALTDLNTANISTLKDFNYFAKSTPSKVVNFEMEAMRYNCE